MMCASRQIRQTFNVQVLPQVHTGRKASFVFSAVITHSRLQSAAQHLEASWFEALVKSYKSHSSQAACPLYSTLLKCDSVFTKASPYRDNLLANTSVTACLLDLRTFQMFTLHYGNGASAPCVEMEGYGEQMHPVKKLHFVNGVEVHSEQSQLAPGQHTIVLGGTGLW